MNCAYHSQNGATTNCNGCGRPLCAACDHRIKGFPFCQDCIVLGVDLLRERNQSNHVPFVKKTTSPFVATLLSVICPGLGAAYNGQMAKALVHFAVFVGLFQMAGLAPFRGLFVFGFMGMWCYAAVDSWRTAQIVRSGLAPDAADDILAKRFSGNSKLWAIILGVLGVAFVGSRFIDRDFLYRGILPVMLIGLGIYVGRGYIFKPKAAETDYGAADHTTSFALTQSRYRESDYNVEPEFSNRSRAGSWKDR